MSERHFPEPVFDDAIDARARVAKAKAEQREVARQRFRHLFPKTTEFADLCRKHFGDQVEILHAIEDGLYVGPVPEKDQREYEKKFGGKLRKVRLSDPIEEVATRPQQRQGTQDL